MENDKLVRMRAVQDAIDNLDWIDGGGGKIYVRQTELVDAIDSIPAVDAAEVVHAYYIPCKSGYGYKCSNCKAREKAGALISGTHKFCYACGAQMGGAEDGR